MNARTDRYSDKQTDRQTEFTYTMYMLGLLRLIPISAIIVPCGIEWCCLYRILSTY